MKLEIGNWKFGTGTTKQYLSLITDYRLLITCILLFASLSPASAQWLPGHDFVGKWVRSDGTYQLIVKSVKNDGTAEVLYLNPGSINVESATLKQEEKLLILTIVLRDEGYPGSTYELFYHPDKDLLVGYYRMPAQDQRFEVTFSPVKEEEEKSAK